LRLSSAARNLTDEELIARLKQCVTRGRPWEARTLVHMSEVDARKHGAAEAALSVSSAHGVTAAAPSVTSAHVAAEAAPCVSPAEAVMPSMPGTEAQAFRLEPPVNTFSLVPLSEGRTAVRFTASQRWGDTLRQAQHLMRHRVPGGDPVAILECALDLLIAERRKALFGRTDKPRRTSPKAASRRKPSRYVPDAVRREVADRDGEQCAFVAPDGRRCAERGRIELDHHPVPAARGGRSTTDNLRLLCAAHNALAAERAYGPAFIRRRIAAAREANPSSRASRSQNAPRESTRQRVEDTTSPALQGSDSEATALVPVTGRANHPLAAGGERATENAEHRPSLAAASGSEPPAGVIIKPTLAMHRPDGALAERRRAASLRR
jgi:5-methylcytosine-specific restriction endonuclease McrA